MLQAKVGYSKTLDAYEAGVETAKKASEGISPKIAFLFNSVGYDQKKLMEGAKSILKDIEGNSVWGTAGVFEGLNNIETLLDKHSPKAIIVTSPSTVEAK